MIKSEFLCTANVIFYYFKIILKLCCLARSVTALLKPLFFKKKIPQSMKSVCLPLHVPHLHSNCYFFSSHLPLLLIYSAHLRFPVLSRWRVFPNLCPWIVARAQVCRRVLATATPTRGPWRIEDPARAGPSTGSPAFHLWALRRCPSQMSTQTTHILNHRCVSIQ